LTGTWRISIANRRIAMKKSLMILWILVLLPFLLPLYSHADYSNDFETSVGLEWSHRKIDQTPKGNRKFLGQFGNETVSLTLVKDRSGPGNIVVEFDLYLINSWDGNEKSYGPDVWSLGVEGGAKLIRTTFSNLDEYKWNQSYPNSLNKGNFPPHTKAKEHDSLGYTYFGDSVYRLTFTFNHPEKIIKLNFAATGLQEMSDESWGLDNIKVRGASVPKGPHTKTEDWNQNTTIKVNNCYNYATDYLNKDEKGWSGLVLPAEPGAIGKYKNLYETRRVEIMEGPHKGEFREEQRITWERLKEALIRDGLHEKEDCSAKGHQGCWRVACFIKHDDGKDLAGQKKDPTEPRKDDVHFAREDSPGKWSHKCCHKHRASHKCIIGYSAWGSGEDPYFGKPITDPSKETIKPGYKFCGYLYANHSVKVANSKIVEINDYSEAIQKNPKDVQAYFKRGNAYSRLGGDRKAIEDYTKVIKLAPKEPAIYYIRGTSFNRIREYRKAIADWEKAISLNEDYRSRLAEKIEEAKKALKKLEEK
jgi:hypothetical protein